MFFRLFKLVKDEITNRPKRADAKTNDVNNVLGRSPKHPPHHENSMSASELVQNILIIE